MGKRVIFKNLLLIVFLIFALWSVRNFWQNPISRPCNFLAISIDLPLRMEEAITMDGGQKPILTRFFHNKALFYGTSLTQCYLEYLTPPLLFSFLSPIGLLFFLFGFYFCATRLRGKKSSPQYFGGR